MALANNFAGLQTFILLYITSYFLYYFKFLLLLCIILCYYLTLFRIYSYYFILFGFIGNC
jgi:hypothetical protein